MTEWTEDQDPYEVLGLTQGHDSTETQIKKASFFGSCVPPDESAGQSLDYFVVLTGLQIIGSEEAS